MLCYFLITVFKHFQNTRNCDELPVSSLRASIWKRVPREHPEICLVASKEPYILIWSSVASAHCLSCCRLGRELRLKHSIVFEPTCKNFLLTIKWIENNTNADIVRGLNEQVLRIYLLSIEAFTGAIFIDFK